MPVVDGIPLAYEENGKVKVDDAVPVADVQLADVGMCEVVVALASTSVFVMVLVQVSVVVVLLASTDAGASRATSVAAAVVRRIGKECGKRALVYCWCGVLNYKMVKRVNKSRKECGFIGSIDPRLCLFLSSLAGSRPGGCFRSVLFGVAGAV